MEIEEEEDSCISSSNDESRDSAATSSSDSEDSDIEKPPETRQLPQRATRGRRYKRLEGSEAEVDEEFWRDEVWAEEKDDGEWSTENEKHYKDEFDSDFLNSTDEDEDEQMEMQLQGEMIDKKAQTSSKSDKKKFDYNLVAKRRAQREQKNILAPKKWSVLDRDQQSGKGDSARIKNNGKSNKWTGGRKDDSRKKNDDKRFWSQADHMREAMKTEQMNVEIMNREKELLEEMKLRSSNSRDEKADARFSGAVDIWISWSSDRKIEAEENKKTPHQRQLEAFQPPHERQLLLFVNTSNPQAAAIHTLYTQPPRTFNSKDPFILDEEMPHARHPQPLTHPNNTRPVYIDPVTKQTFTSISEFRAIRQRTVEDELKKVSAIVTRHLPTSTAC